MISRKILISCLIIILLPLLTVLIPLEANAAAPTITIDPIAAATNTNFDMCISWASADLVNTDDLTVVFENSATATARFDVEALTASEVTFYYDSNDCGVADNGGDYEARLTETGTDDANDHDKITIITRALGAILGIDDWVGFSINLDTNTSVGAFNIADSLPISIGIANVAGNSLLTPTDAGNYKILIQQAVSGTQTDVDWLDTQLLYIGGDNLVTITATLDPSISLSITEANCLLGILSQTQIKTCGTQATITTNIGTGYTSYIEQDQSFQSNVNGVTHEIGDPGDALIEASGAMDGTYGEYGISILTDDTTGWEVFSGACADYNEQSITPFPAQQLAGDATRYTLTSYTTPVNGVDHGIIDICAGVRIGYDTPPGIYSHTLTITIVGNF